jgi:uncharacterized Zn-binding protein involved in type VI secretion
VIADGVKAANQGVQAVNGVVAKANTAATAIANPGAAIAGAVGGAVDEKMSSLTNGLAAAMPPFPAATMTGMALGIPHAHVKHPPSGPPPIPPTPLPPLGPIMVGNSITVLINGKPAARCGDYGFNPTCCGIVPPLSAMFEIVTGSSKVYIGGSRAARANIDVTMHCFKMPKGPKVLVKSAALAKVAKAAGKVAKAAGKVANVVGKVTNVVGTVSTAANFAADFADAEADDNAAMAAAVALSAAMMAAQAAADAAASALSAQIGTDQPCIPPVGTPGMILVGSPNVLISGVPLPSFSAIAQGLAKRLKGVKFKTPKSKGKGGKGGGKGGRAGPGGR